MKKYFFQADVVRVLAIFGVIGIHLVTPITARPDFFGGSIWWLTFILNGIFRVSVPLFIMLSGYLSLGKNIGIRENFYKVFKRLIIPLSSYYIIYNVINAIMANLRNEPFEYWDIFHNLSKNTHTILYFLVILVFLQLLNPLWNLLAREKNSEVYKYVMKFFLALGAVAYIFYDLSLREGEVFSTYTLWVMWIGYYLYGYYVKVRKFQFDTQQLKKYWAIYAVGLTLTIQLGYIILFLFHKGFGDLFYIDGQAYSDSYLSVSVMMMALPLFPLLMKSGRIENLASNTNIKNVVVFLSAISYGLYLNHIIVMDILNKFYGVTPDSPSMPGLAGYLAINTFLTLAISTLIVLIIKKVPALRTIIGE